tara:strand:- start:162 stop:494 length:333 start_codon:yes stop_codon:yes gene_type:complete
MENLSSEYEIILEIINSIKPFTMPTNIIEDGIQRCSRSINEIDNNVITRIHPKIITIKFGRKSNEVGLEYIDTRNNTDDKTSIKKYLKGIFWEQKLHLPFNNNQLSIGIF